MGIETGKIKMIVPDQKYLIPSDGSEFIVESITAGKNGIITLRYIKSKTKMHLSFTRKHPQMTIDIEKGIFKLITN